MEAEEMTPQELRAAMAKLAAAAETALREPGQRRIRLLSQLDEVDVELRPLVVDATNVGVPHRRIAEMTGLSKNTVLAWSKRAKEPNDNDN